MNYSKLITVFLLCFFVFANVNMSLSAERCDFFITKKDLKEMDRGNFYISPDTTGTACLKNYDNRYIYYPIKNGKIDGLVKKYYYDDFLELTTPYKNGIRSGIEKRYFPSGAILRETPYKDGIRQGTEKVYYEVGGVESEFPYIDDKIEGIRKDYYMDGILHATFTYKNGFKDGITKKYYRNGSLKLERMYKQGRKHGLEKEYSQTGILLTSSPFKNGSVDGQLKIYDKKTGKPFLFVDYVKGLKNGNAVKYSYDGKIYAVINFKNDYVMDGKCTNGYLLTQKDLETIQYSIYSINCGE